MAIAQSGPAPDVRARLPKPGAEVLATLGGTLLAATLLVLAAMNVGPLWRDEVNTANLAQMPSAHDFWLNLSFESFPPLWPLLLRSGYALGWVDGDWTIRVMGLYVGFLFLGSLWLCIRWLGGRAPTLSVALLGCLPAFIFIVGANRAYGLGCCLLVLSFGTIWRLLECLSPARILLAGGACLLFAHCVYYDVILLGAMLAGGVLVALRRHQWKTLGVLAAMGLICAGSMAIYVPVVRRGSDYAVTIPSPAFHAGLLWYGFGDAVTCRSSGEFGRIGLEPWLWVGLLLAGLAAAMVVQRTGTFRPSRVEAPPPGSQRRADMALFCAVSMVLGILGLTAFYLKIRYLTSSWYFVEILCLGCVAFDGLLGANWPALRPWGAIRIVFLVGMMSWGVRAGWNEAHTRRSSVDSIAAVLSNSASDKDLIVVGNAWEGITFNRYYHGAAHWVTVPPLASHLVHRNDLMFEKMHRPEAALDPVLRAIENTLREGRDVWLVGNLIAASPAPRGVDRGDPYIGTYELYWEGQVSAFLLEHATKEQVLDVSGKNRVFFLENPPALVFTGYKSGTGATNAPPSAN